MSSNKNETGHRLIYFLLFLYNVFFFVGQFLYNGLNFSKSILVNKFCCCIALVMFPLTFPTVLAKIQPHNHKVKARLPTRDTRHATKFFRTLFDLFFGCSPITREPAKSLYIYLHYNFSRVIAYRASRIGKRPLKQLSTTTIRYRMDSVFFNSF